jgi:hypothetical protein
LVFTKNGNIFAEIWRHSPKIEIITSTPNILAPFPEFVAAVSRLPEPAEQEKRFLSV